MKMVELLSAFMEREFGSSAKACARLKALVNEALDQGEWHDVARFVGGSMVWVTKRIAYDGIYLTAIVNGEVLGERHYPGFPVSVRTLPHRQRRDCPISRNEG